MAEVDNRGVLPTDTTQFFEQMDGELLGWAHPAERLREALEQDHLRLHAQPVRTLEDAGFAAYAVARRALCAGLLRRPPGADRGTAGLTGPIS